MSTFDQTNLPPVQEGSGGHMRPKVGGSVAVCMAPLSLEVPAPANWGVPEGKMLNVPAGAWLQCLGPEDTYPNAEFEETSSLTGVWLDPGADERAAELHNIFSPLRVLVLEAKKTVGVKVHGVVSSDVIGETFKTPLGNETLAEGDVIVESPRTGHIWRITPENRASRYEEAGRIFEGELPSEYC